MPRTYHRTNSRRSNSKCNNEENKAVLSSFVEEVINQGRLERANDLVAPDFVELDPLPGQQQGEQEGAKFCLSTERKDQGRTSGAESIASEAITAGSEGQINIDLQTHSGSGEGRYFPRNANYRYLHAHPAGDLFHLAINSVEST